MIGDLGHAKYLENQTSRISVSSAAFGTYGYHAPEVSSNNYDHKIDIWLFKLH